MQGLIVQRDCNSGSCRAVALSQTELLQGVSTQPDEILVCLHLLILKSLLFLQNKWVPPFPSPPLSLFLSLSLFFLISVLDLKSWFRVLFLFLDPIKCYMKE